MVPAGHPAASGMNMTTTTTYYLLLNASAVTLSGSS
jgi:hypothetical protein